ncbi:RDD family protein [Cerasicoccus frondis]|uniref:RDD family protein n=1 Tax=Cerasicoccus frondis TaxID=490090 RepID=UPI002852503E|nr:RDD family protein [Cerasicoccus frondis]
MAKRNPSQPPPLPQQLPELPVIVVATREKRTISALLDFSIILLVAGFLLSKFFWPTMYPQTWTEYMAWSEAYMQDFPEIPPLSMSAQEGILFAYTLTAGLVWLYFFLSEVLMQGSSLGKSVFGLRVMSLRHAGPPTPLEAGVRASIKASCIFMVVPLLVVNYFVMLFHRQRQALHDIPASTLVVAAPAMITVAASDETQ